jgi:hypothetical protein
MGSERRSAEGKMRMATEPTEEGKENGEGAMKGREQREEREVGRKKERGGER